MISYLLYFLPKRVVQHPSMGIFRTAHGAMRLFSEDSSGPLQAATVSWPSKV